MKRGKLITVLTGAMLAWPLVSRAQQPEKVHRIAILHPSLPAAQLTLGETPFYQSTTLNLIKNLKTTAALALRLRPSLSVPRR
jgi:hypothetical protein